MNFIDNPPPHVRGTTPLPPPPVIPAQIPALPQQSVVPPNTVSTIGTPQVPSQVGSLNPAGQAQLAQVMTPQNPVLQSALIQAALQQQGQAQGGVTMDDIANLMLNQGRPVRPRPAPQSGRP